MTPPDGPPTPGEGSPAPVEAGAPSPGGLAVPAVPQQVSPASGADEGGVPDEVEPEPEAAGELFGEQLALARRYVALLVGPGTTRGVLGPRETTRIWSRHVLNSAVVAELLPDEPVTVLDLGTGGGLPGIPLALARPQDRVVLVDSLLRRTTFLGEVVDALGLGAQVEVVRGRAEELRARFAVDVVVARAVAPLERLTGWALPLLRPGGQLLALRGLSAAEEVEETRGALTRVGADLVEVVTAGARLVPDPTTVVRVRRRGGAR